MENYPWRSSLATEQQIYRRQILFQDVHLNDRIYLSASHEIIQHIGLQSKVSNNS